MTAQTKYITSIIKTFSTYLENLNISSKLNEETTAKFVKFLHQKKNYDSWSIKGLEKFLKTEKSSSNAVVLIKRFIKNFTPYQVDIFLHQFLKSLKKGYRSNSTIKNYRSDISQLISLSGINKIEDLFTQVNIKDFVKNQFAKNLKVGTVKRKLVSITQFAGWAEDEGLIKDVLFWISDVEGLFGKNSRKYSGKNKNLTLNKTKTTSKEVDFCKPTGLPLSELDTLSNILAENSNLSIINRQIKPKNTTVLLEEFLLNLEINSSSKSTVKNYKSDVLQLINFVDRALDRKMDNKTKTTSKEVGFCKPVGLPGKSDKLIESLTKKCKTVHNQKTASNEADLAHLIDLKLDWLNNSKEIVAKKWKNVKLNNNKRKNYVDVDLPGIEPGRRELLSQSSKPTRPTSECNISQIKPKTYPLTSIITQENLRSFIEYQKSKGLKPNSIKRKLVSISQFSIWAEERGELKNTGLWMGALQSSKFSSSTPHNIELKLKNQNKIKIVNNETTSKRWSLPVQGFVKNTSQGKKTGIGTKKLTNHNYKSNLKENLKEFASSINAKKNKTFLPYFNLVMIALFLLGIGYFGYQQFVKQAPDSLAYPTTPVRPNRELSFQGRLTDTAQNPITTASNMAFRLYDTGPGTGGTLLWDSSTCSVTPDQDGIFNVGLGDDCGSEISENVFTENSNVWLEVDVVSETLTPRQSIKTVAYAINSETVQGYPVSATGAATTNTILVMDSAGQVLLGEVSPTLKSTTGTFSIEAQALTLQTSSGSNGDIILDPDGTGEVLSTGYFYAPGATFAATYAGGTSLVLRGGPGGTGNIQEWQDSSGTVLSVVDESGNVGVGTTDPQKNLHIQSENTSTSQLRLQNTAAGAGNYTLDIGMAWQDQSFSINTGGTNIMKGYGYFDTDELAIGVFGHEESIYINTNGNVGIGTTSPLFLLDVAGTASVNSLNINDSYTFPTADGSVDYILQTDGAGAVSWEDPSNITGAGLWANTLNLFHPKNELASVVDLALGGTSTASANIHLKADGQAYFAGNVGVGTTVPGANLEVYETGANATFNLTRDSGATIQGIASTTWASLGTSGGQTFALRSNGTDRISLDTNGDISFNSGDVFFENSSGNVGIGTTAPGALFEVNGTENVAKARITSTSSGAQSYAQATGGLELTATGMNTTYKYTPIIKFGSTDPELTTLNPKFLAGIAGYATETYDGDTKGGMGIEFFTTDNAQGVSTTPTSRMVIDEAGNVGMGTDNPQSNLHIKQTTGDAELRIQSGGADGDISWLRFQNSTDNDNFAGGISSIRNSGLDHDLAFYTWGNPTGTERMRILNNGNVGIGTTAPGTKLEVNSGTTNTVSRFISSDAGSTIAFKDNTTSNSYLGLGALGDDLLFYSAAGNENMRIQGGNLGIGTTAPETLLHLSGSGTGMRVRLDDTSDGDTAITQTMPGIELLSRAMNTTSKYTSALKFGSTDTSLTTTNPKFLSGIVGRATEGYGADTDSGMALDFMTTPDNAGASSVPTVNMTLDQNGNLGIGTSTPITNLDISQDNSSTSIFGTSEDVIIRNTNGTNNTWSGIGFRDTGSIAAGIAAQYYDTTNNYASIHLSTRGASGWGANTLVAYDSKVGIGDPTPDAPLDVVGDVYISDGLSLYETAVSDGTVEATKFCTGDGETNCVTDFSSLGGGSSLFTDGGTITYLTSTTDDLALGGTDSTSPFFFDESAEILTLTNTTAGDSFRVNDVASDTTPFVIDADGNVGIGTTGPLAQLHIVQNQNDAIYNEMTAVGPSDKRAFRTAITSNTSSAVNIYGLEVYDNNSIAGATVYGVYVNIDDPDTTNYGIYSAGGVNYFSDNVGIGTSSPTKTLDVVGNTLITPDTGGVVIDQNNNNIALSVKGGGSGINIAQFIRDVGATANINLSGSGGEPQIVFDTVESSSPWAIGVDDGAESFNIAQNSAIGTNDFFTILTSGNVGIGTTSPAQKLTISQGDIQIDHTTFANQDGIIYKSSNTFIHNFNYGDNGTVTTNGANTFVGASAGNLTMGSTATLAWQGSYNTGIGQNSLSNLTTGYANIGMGYATLNLTTTGAGNTAIGDYSLRSSTGNSNSALGRYSLLNITSGSNNIALGAYSGRYESDGSTSLTSLSNSVIIGYNAKANASGDTNEIAIGYDVTGLGSNTVVLGNSSIATTALRGNVGIGTTGPGDNLHLSDTNTGLILDGGANWATGSEYIKFARGGSSAWTFGNDQDSTNNLYFASGDGFSTKRVTFQQNGNVGIGTTAPNAPLEINNATSMALNITGTPASDWDHGLWLDGKAAVTEGGDSGWLRLNQNSSFTSGTYTPGILRADSGLRVNDDEGFYWIGEDLMSTIGDNDGLRLANLLIDTSTIINDSAITINDANRYIWTPSSGWGEYWNTTDNAIEFYGGGSQVAEIDLDNGYIYGERFLDNSNSSYFLDPAAGDKSLIVAGNVGIGTTGPETKLDVDGLIKYKNMVIDNGSATSADKWFNFASYSTTSAYQSDVAYITIGSHWHTIENTVKFIINAHTAAAVTTNDIDLVPVRAVGSSTEIPNIKVIITDDASVSGTFSVELYVQSMSNWRDLEIVSFSQEKGDSDWTIQADDTGTDTGSLPAGTQTDLGTAISSDTSGNVGIGTTSPTQALDVAGNITTSGQLQVGGYASTPTAIGEGSMIFNTTNNTHQCYNGTSWYNCGGTLYSNTNASVASGSYITVNHDLASTDLLSNAWINSQSTWKMLDANYQPAIAWEGKDTQKGIYRNAVNSYSPGNETGADTSTLHDGYLFDTFEDETKTDDTNTTVSIATQQGDDGSSNFTTLDQRVQDGRVGLAGGQTMSTATTDNAGNTYLGSNAVNDMYYYDRGRDSTPEVQVELGIDPNWYNGVTLSVATSSAQFSQNSTVPDPNPNLTTTYNGSLVKASGRYSSGGQTIFATIKSPTTYDWTDYNGEAATGVSIDPGTSQALGATGVSLTFTGTNYNVGDVFKVASWFVEATGSTRGGKQQFPERSNVITESFYVDIIDIDTQKLWMRINATSWKDSAGSSSSEVLNGILYKGDASGIRRFDFTTDTDKYYFSTNGLAKSDVNTNIASRNTAGTALNIINSSLALINATVNDVSAAVIPNQPTQEMTVTGWGYIVGDDTAIIEETVNLPYKFNDLPNITATIAGNTSTTPKDLSSCNEWASSHVNVAVGGETTKSSFQINQRDTRETALSSSYYFCYTWTATGTVSPKQFVAVATDGGATVINETEQSAIDIYYAVTTDDGVNDVHLTSKGELYYNREYSSSSTRPILGVLRHANSLSSDGIFADSYSFPYYWGSIPAINTASTDDIYSIDVTENTSSINGIGNTVYLGTNNGTVVIQEKHSTANKLDGSEENQSSVKYYTKDYISEEMVGDIRGMWPLNGNNTASDFEDVSVKANNLTGTNITSADAVSGVRGEAYDFDGSTEYLSCTDASCGGTSGLDMGTSDFTVGAWIKTTDSGFQEIIRKGTGAAGNEYYLLRTQSSKINFSYWDGATTVSSNISNQLINDGEWHHIVGVADRDTGVKLYIDGQLDKEVAGSATASMDSTSSFSVGIYADAANTHFNGTIDEPFVTATAISAQKIKQMYEVGSRALESHSLDLGGSIGLGSEVDNNQKLGATSNLIGAVMPDKNNQYMYVASQGLNTSAVSRIQLNSDTNMKTYFTYSSNKPSGGTQISSFNNITSLAVSNHLEAVGSYGDGVQTMGFDDYSTATTGNFVSKTTTLPNNIGSAVLWVSPILDSDDGSNTVTVKASNDNGSTYDTCTLVETDSNHAVAEKEYACTFTAGGNQLKVKFEFARGSTKTNTYITQYGISWLGETGFRIEQADNNNVRLYNYSGETQNLKLNVTGAGTATLATPWTDGGSYLYATGYETLRMYDGGGTNYVSLSHDGTVGNIGIDGSTSMSFDSSGNVGIGTTSPGSKLHINNTTTDTSGNTYGGLNFTGSQTTAHTGTYLGVTSTPQFTATTGNTLTTMYGMYSNPINASSGTVTNLIGSSFAPSNNSSGTVGNIHGVQALPYKNGTGDVTNVYSIFSRVGNTNATGTITNAYGIYIDDSLETGTITNDWGIYQVDTGAKNYFGGSIGIATSAPAAKLSISLDSVNDPINYGRGIQITGSTSGGQQIAFVRHGSKVRSLGYLPSSNTFGFGDGNSTDSSFTPNILAMDTNGNVGIGTTSPAFKLDVAGKTRFGTTSLTDSAAFHFSHGTLTTGQVSMYIDVQDTGVSNEYFMQLIRGNASDNEFLFRTDGTAHADGSFTGGGADVAEYYYLQDNTEEGDLVSIPTTINSNFPAGKTLEKSSGSSYDGSVIGIVSTNPGLVAGGGNAEIDNTYTNQKPIALAGRVPVKVSVENGEIKKGDPLTSSSTPGVAMKASSAGQIIGRALEDYDGTQQISDGVLIVENERLETFTYNDPIPIPNEGIGKIMTFVNTTYHDPNIYLTDTGNLIINKNPDTDQYLVTDTLTNNLIDTVGIFAKAVIANIQAGLITAKQISSEELISPIINTSKINTASSVTISRNTNLESEDPVLVVDGSFTAGKTSLTSLLTQEATISGNLAVTGSTTISNSLDVSGTTTLLGDLYTTNINSATLSATTVTTTHLEATSSRIAALEAGMAELENIKATTAEIVNATVSGTLYASNIYDFETQIANSLQTPGLLDLITGQNESSASANYLAELYETTNSSGFEAIAMADLDLTLDELSLTETDVVLTGSALFIEKYFKVNGAGFISDSLAVGNSIFAGTALVVGSGDSTTQISNGIIAYTTPNPNDQILKIQPTGLGSIELLAGLVTLDDSGLVTVNGNFETTGNAKIGGTLLTDLIQPSSFDNPFQVQVAGIDTESGEVKESRFEIINEVGTPVATFSAQGSAKFAGTVEVEGGISIGSENLGASAINELETNKTAGTAIIASGASQVKIESNLITDNTMIYVTAVGSTNNQVMFVKSQLPHLITTTEYIEGDVIPPLSEVIPATSTEPAMLKTITQQGEFTVGFDNVTVGEVSFNWWVVN